MVCRLRFPHHFRLDQRLCYMGGLSIGADIGKAFNLGWQAMGLQVVAYDFVKRPDGTLQWMIRVQLTLLFPTGK